MTGTIVNQTRRLRFAAAGSIALALAVAGCSRPETAAQPAPGGLAQPVAGAPAAPEAAPPASASTSAASTSAPPSSPVPPRVPAASGSPGGAGGGYGVHFDTPQAAMRYLTAAYNSGDNAALKKVTTPAARADLIAMRAEAVNLQLTGCSRRPIGDYVCTFRHDYPAGQHRTGHGQATFLAAPATKQGWYMTVLIDCG